MNRIALILILQNLCNLVSAVDESPEALYRRTIKEWRTKRSYEPWMKYGDDLLEKFDTSSNRLEIVGGFEEGVLAIEKATVARGEADNKERDIALSKLYYGYGYVLMELDASECQSLALDPHTLLIGAETVSKNDEPSTDLCLENAENSLRNAVTLDATNKVADDLLQRITGMDSVHKRKPKEFVAELFDSFADSFDEKLLDGLQYKVPQMIGKSVLKLGDKFENVLDAGCGTGLAGRFLKPLVQNVMVGVDASQKMLDIAEKCTVSSGCGLKDTDEVEASDKTPLYDDLLVLDLEDMSIENTLKGKGDGFDLIVAADVFVYFGSLANVLKTFSNISTKGSKLIFTAERATEEEAPLGWRLLSSGRFAHTKKHVVEAAAAVGYELTLYQEIVPRMEKGEEVQGHMFGFALSNASSGNSEL
ncbi:hypothetical protein CTEN210_01693 [Chaetoceros tenuissimus]|uniref:Methyltransferase domain-containing protein n=1 Tax=Chaetoceros tenuissimus TaxID=426638 RepID=A0AAD3CGH8_9STRA|nr:hypothetical protein CTEN210_01693 [Chaetoceros tenuissimus]